MVWQVYDWYLQAHGGFYGTKKSAAPLYSQYNRRSQKIEVINASLESWEETLVSATLYNKNMDLVWETSEMMDLGENSVYELDEKVPLDEHVSFLKLEMQNPEGKILTDNFYWLSTSNNFSFFNELPEPILVIEAQEIGRSERYVSYQVDISNTGESLALMTTFKLLDPLTGLEILPSFWNDNYISLLPGEQKTITVSIVTDNLPKETALSWKSFNMPSPKVLKLK